MFIVPAWFLISLAIGYPRLLARAVSLMRSVSLSSRSRTDFLWPGLGS